MPLATEVALELMRKGAKVVVAIDGGTDSISNYETSPQALMKV